MSWVRAGAIVVLMLAPARAAKGEELRAHAALGVAHAVGAPQGQEFGLGGVGSVSLEVPLGRAAGLEVTVGGLVLTQGDPPSDPSLARQGTGTALLGTVGLRLRPFTHVAGPWLGAGVGGAQTGTRTRFAFDSALGWDFRLRGGGRWDVGPYVGFLDVVQPDDSVRPNDGYVVSLGIHIGLGVLPAKPVETDRDKDGIADREDACPDVPGIYTTDPKTNGCPRGDRDKDTVFDDEDACPDVPGIRTIDPKTNGCPRSDRDKDTVFDDEDACPEVPGVRTSDPKTNGCPRGDRDKDTVFDDEDACPDVPGVRSDDPKANGCPASTESIRLEKDRILMDEVILFDLDSPRVRHASWGVVQKLADFIAKNPDILEVSIEGHADATGSEQHNLRLSKDRAESVRRLLIQFGIAPDRVKAEAFGRSRLKVQTEKAEAANRRVEFWVTRTRPANTPPPSGATP